MSLKTKLFIFLCLFLSATVQAQKTPVDSLKNVLNTAINDTLRVNVLNQIAFLLRNSDIKTSFNYVLQANELAKKINYKNGIAESYGYMGLLYYREGKYDLSVEAHLKSLRLYEELGNKRFIAFRYNDLGNVYVEQEFYDRARTNFNLSLSIKEQIKDEEGIVTTMKNIANLYVHQRNYPKALEICLRILPRAEKVNNKRIIADTHSFIAECYLHQDSLDKAMFYYEKVYEARLKANDQYTMPRLLNGIGRAYHLPKNSLERFHYWYDLMNMVLADNIIHEKELEYCEQMAKIFGYKPEVIDITLRQIKEGKNHEQLFALLVEKKLLENG